MPSKARFVWECFQQKSTGPQFAVSAVHDQQLLSATPQLWAQGQALAKHG